MIKHDMEYSNAIGTARAKMETPGADVIKENPWIHTSNMSDAYLIACWSLYHSGKMPRALHKSRGNSWLADIPGRGEYRLEVIDSKDHRNGIKETPM